MNTSCPYCNHVSSRKLFESQDRLNQRPSEGHAIYLCDQCGLVFLCPQTKQDDFERYYDTEYISFHPPRKRLATQTISRKRKLLRNMRAKVWQSLFGVTIDSRLSKSPGITLELFSRTKFFRARPLHFDGNGLRLLDVSCGRGDFLYECHKRGWNVSGLEPSKNMVEDCLEHGLDVRQGFSIRKHWNDPVFDFVTLNQVFEHLDNPSQTLFDIHHVLKEKGVLYMNMPNIRSLPAKLFRSFWYNLDTPRHNILVSPVVLQNIVSQHGFDVISIYTSSSVKGWTGSIEYLMRDFLGFSVRRNVIRNNYLLNKLFLPVVKVCDWFTVGDNIHIIARKSN